MSIELGNLTLITTKNICNKNCPFCIAKSTGKIYNQTIENKDEFNNFENILEKLEKEKIRFNRLVISGNGEPSFYDYEQILTIVNAIKKHMNIFNGVRIHTSGNIFYNENMFNLFNELENIEFNILRVSLDSEKDMQVLKYNKDYMKTKLFKIAKNIKMDIALTEILDYKNFDKELKKYIELFPNIKNVRLKQLLCGKDNTTQTKWIKDHMVDEKIIKEMLDNILIDYKLKQQYEEKYIYENEKNKLTYGASGNFKYYNNDFVISNNKFMNYDEEIINIEDIYNLCEI